MMNQLMRVYLVTTLRYVSGQCEGKLSNIIQSGYRCVNLVNLQQVVQRQKQLFYN